jgi:hypothetical protein
MEAVEMSVNYQTVWRNITEEIQIKFHKQLPLQYVFIYVRTGC